MVADTDLLEKAKTAGAGLAEAERQVLLCRAEYHTAISLADAHHFTGCGVHLVQPPAERGLRTHRRSEH